MSHAQKYWNKHLLFSQALPLGVHLMKTTDVTAPRPMLYFVLHVQDAKVKLIHSITSETSTAGFYRTGHRVWSGTKCSSPRTLPGTRAVSAVTPAQHPAPQAHLIEFPVELSRLEGLALGGLLAEQEHQAAVVHVQAVVVPVHIWGGWTELFPAHLTNKVHLLCNSTLKHQ